MTTYTRIKEESKLEGKLEEKIEVVLNAHDNDLALTMIANITQLTESEIIQILKDHKRLYS